VEVKRTPAVNRGSDVWALTHTGKCLGWGVACTRASAWFAVPSSTLLRRCLIRGEEAARSKGGTCEKQEVWCPVFSLRSAAFGRGNQGAGVHRRRVSTAWRPKTLLASGRLRKELGKGESRLRSQPTAMARSCDGVLLQGAISSKKEFIRTDWPGSAKMVQLSVGSRKRFDALGHTVSLRTRVTLWVYLTKPHNWGGTQGVGRSTNQDMVGA